jgi:hypothetical protein
VTEIQYVDWYMTLTSTRRWELMNWVWMSWCYNIGSTCTCCRCPITQVMIVVQNAFSIVVLFLFLLSLFFMLVCWYIIRSYSTQRNFLVYLEGSLHLWICLLEKRKISYYYWRVG